ncbi:MAG: hypothetical protein EXQ94_02515 [Alphaproteobacteria bacterium]|nr:hypothetical protein [Alphaproteobacteria bacterium]
MIPSRSIVRRSRAGFAALVAALALAACASPGPGEGPRRFLAQFDDRRPTIDRVPICYGYGCAKVSEIEIGGSWPTIAALFLVPSGDAATERARIAEAVALFESAAARATPIGADLAGTFNDGGGAGQLDCVDEAANTTRLLVLLDDARLLKFHQVGSPSTRGLFIQGWPHTTAAIVERGTGRRYAVDSWFHDNGQPAEIVPIDQWLAGWEP